MVPSLGLYLYQRTTDFSDGPNPVCRVMLSTIYSCLSAIGLLERLLQFDGSVGTFETDIVGTALLALMSVGPDKRQLRTRLYRGSLALRSTLVLYANFSGCTKMSQSFRCLATSFRKRMRIVLL